MMHFAKSSILVRRKTWATAYNLICGSDGLAVFCTNKLRLRPRPQTIVDMHPCRYNVAALLERQSHARTLLEVIEGQQMVSGGEVNETQRKQTNASC
jgi:hypothetical protein